MLVRIQPSEPARSTRDKKSQKPINKRNDLWYNYYTNKEMKLFEGDVSDAESGEKNTCLGE